VKLVLIPSFLAHGIAGDLDKVPPQSPLRYDLRLVELVR
jgi:FKBP-type peptidyl-prolyl cis-trans isomerase